MSDGSRDEIEEILNETEYQVYYEQSQGLFDRLIDWIQTWVDELLASLFPGMVGSSSISGLVYVALIVIIIAILVMVFIFVGRNVKRSRQFRETKPLQDLNKRKWSFQHHLAEAKRQESSGEYTLATRHMFLALLLYFHGIKWLEARIWKTNIEYYEELKEVDKEAAEFFYTFVLLFDQITYGERNVTKEEYLPYKDAAMNWLERSKQVEEEGKE